jgi:hypothetical protein
MRTDKQDAGDGQFRITRARGRVEVDGTVISKFFPFGCNLEPSFV